MEACQPATVSQPIDHDQLGVLLSTYGPFTRNVAEKFLTILRGQHRYPMVLATSCGSPESEDISPGTGPIGERRVYIDANSARLMNVAKVPAHTKRKPYTRPAGPPLNIN